MTALTPAVRADIAQAAEWLEQPRLGVKIANMAGKPLDGALNLFPSVNKAMQNTLQAAISRCLQVAIESQAEEDFVPSPWRARLLTGLTGGLGGLFGAAALPVELPVTITLMLRGIADIARERGEDLRALEPRLACLQVFALGDRGHNTRGAGAATALNYYAARVTLARLTSNVVSNVAERAILDASAPMASRFVGELVSRLGVVLSERIAAGAVPVLGAVGGATLNMIFMDHFERLARGHFTLRRLERIHGPAPVKALYDQEVARLRR